MCTAYLNPRSRRFRRIRNHGLREAPIYRRSLFFLKRPKPCLKRAHTQAHSAADAKLFVNHGIQKAIAVRPHRYCSTRANSEASAATATFRVVVIKNGNALLRHLPSTPFRTFFIARFASHFLEARRVASRYSSSSASIPSVTQRSSTTSRDSGLGDGCIS